MKRARTSRTRTDRSRVAVKKAPQAIQAPLDALVRRGKRGPLTPSERHDLADALDHLDKLTIAALTAGTKKRP